MTFLLELRDAARTCPNAEARLQLRECADNISRLAHDLDREPTHDTLRELNGWWARGVRVLEFRDLGGDEPGGAKMRIAA